MNRHNRNSLLLLEVVAILLYFCQFQSFAQETKSGAVGDPLAAEVLCKEAGEHLKKGMLHYDKAKNPPGPEINFNGSVTNYSSAEYMQWGDEEIARAAACFEKSADLEDAHGQYMYGSFLMSGEGVEKDVTKVAELFS